MKDMFVNIKKAYTSFLNEKEEQIMIIRTPEPDKKSGCKGYSVFFMKYLIEYGVPIAKEQITTLRN